MTELQQIKKDLIEFKKSVNILGYLLDRIPKLPPVLPHPSELLDGIKNIIGFIDCMIEFEIPLLPETT